MRDSLATLVVFWTLLGVYAVITGRVKFARPVNLAILIGLLFVSIPWIRDLSKWSRDTYTGLLRNPNWTAFTATTVIGVLAGVVFWVSANKLTDKKTATLGWLITTIISALLLLSVGPVAAAFQWIVQHASIWVSAFLTLGS